MFPRARALCRDRRIRGVCLRRYHELSFNNSGDPAKVLTYQECHDGDATFLEDGQAHVEMLHVPWNPADVNTVQGVYPSINKKYQDVRQSDFFEGFTVAGSEGLGRICAVSELESRLKIGDYVAIGLPGLGTARSKFIAPNSSLILVDRYRDLESKFGGAATSTLLQLGGTALRMLSDFEHLNPRETVIQNAGSSAVAFMASQIAHEVFDTRMISLVRRGSRTSDEFEELKEHLIDHGKASAIFADEDIQFNRESMKNFKSIVTGFSPDGQPPKLALNAVGGASASSILRTLGQSGTIVTYGGMSMEPVIIPTPQLIFNDVSAKGYWHSRWMMQNDIQARQEMMDSLVNCVLDGKVTLPPIEEVALPNAVQRVASDETMKSSVIRRKVVFDCRQKD